MLFLLGVIMAVIGVGFCVLGEIKLFGGRVLRAAPAQICGVVFLSYFPLYFLLYSLIRDWDSIYSSVLPWAVAILCIVIVYAVVMKTTEPARPARSYQEKLTDKPAPFADADEIPAEDNKPSASKKNPFDFS